MRKTMIMLAAATMSMLCTVSAGADTDLVLSSRTTSTKLSLGDVVSLKFVDGALQVKTTTSLDPTVLSLADLRTIRFEDTGTSSIDQGRVAGGEIVLGYRDGQLSAQGVTKADAALYNLSGQRVMNLQAWDGSAVSTSQLPNGVYVFKVNNQTFKFVKK